MNYTSESAIQRIREVTGIEYSKEQLDILNHRGGMCVIACAGSGKTTIITHSIAKRIMTGEIEDVGRLLCTTYSKSGALEMESRLNKLLDKLGIISRAKIKTLHALYLQILTKFGYTANVISSKKRAQFIREACRDIGIKLDDEKHRILDSILSYQINNLLSDDELVRSYIYTLEEIDKNDYRKIREGYAIKKKESDLIDFDDMQLYMYKILVKDQNSEVYNYCREIYNEFYIDEAQDISKIQFEILRVMIRDGSKLVMIGDDDQCIYQWRGADPSILLNICGYYDITKYMLSTNYRCKGNIVSKAAVGVKYNKRRYEKNMLYNEEGGVIKIVDNENKGLYNMSKSAALHIRELIKNGTRPSEIAILTRNNIYQAILSNMLLIEGIYCDAQEEMKLSKTQMYKDIKSAVKLSSNTYDKNLVATHLWKFCPYLGQRGSKAIADFMDNSNMSLRDALGYMFKERGDLGVQWNKNITIPEIIKDRLRYFMQSLKKDTVNGLSDLYVALCVEDYKDRIKVMMHLYKESSSFMYVGQDRERLLKAYIDYVTDLLDVYGERITDLFRMTEQYEEGNYGVLGEKVCMTTIHGSKGREWKNVILFADDNISFPSFDGIVSMLKRGVSINDVSESIDENRRLHYVAFTRAKDELTLFADIDNLSIYTLEALGIFATDDKSNNAHIISMASKGELYDSIVEGIATGLKVENSEYKYKIDVNEYKIKASGF